MTAPESGKRLVLVVDDDEDLRRSMMRLLRWEHYDTLGAANGRQALDVLKEGRRPHVILLDLLMPVMNGMEFLDQMRLDPALADIPVIALSAAGNPDFKKARGVNVFLSKPVEIDELLATIETVGKG